MKAKVLIISFICVLVTICLVIPLVFSLVRPFPFAKLGMFDNINSIQNLQNVTCELTPLQDNDAKDLGKTEELHFKIKYKNSNFILHAYNFIDTANAQLYFKKSTGKSSELSNNYSSSGNFYFSTKMVVYKENKAYKIEGGSAWLFMGFVDILNENFNDKLIF